ncbi:MAG: nuclear transport factor 2 family protein [Chloroflexota bacterium]|nr:nuclear transport factor 2 family protein [Chloroflexota bacterium]
MMLRKIRTTGTEIGLLIVLVMLLTGSLAGTAAAQAEAPIEVLGNRGVAQRFFDDVLNGGDLAAVERLVTSSAVVRTPGGTYHGAAGCGELVAAVQAAYPGATFEVLDMIVDTDAVAVTWRLTGGQPGIPVFADAWSVNGMALLRIENYLIVELWMR